MKNNDYKVIAISGAAGLIGSELSYQLAQENYSLILGDISKKKLISLKKKIGKKKILFFYGNLSLKSEINKFLKLGIKHFTKIDVAINCSYPRTKDWGTGFDKMSQKNLNINLNNQLGGTIIFAQQLIKYFEKKKNGNLINFSSIYGSITPRFELYKNLKISCPIEYVAVKAGIIAITKYLAKLCKNKNIRINCISPGGIVDRQPNIFIKRYQNFCSSKGLLKPSDLYNLIKFLISKDSQYINGQNIIIDDGFSL
jgi:NAD(P)-dependent dehydrogenase (short-subunit alcohol dehydrogenase family)